MIYYYDTYGWLSATPIEGRSTEIVPMQPQGNKRPNFTGHAWILLEYYSPVPITPPPTSASENQAIADQILSATDWTSIPSVGDPLQSNPYLVNQEEWINYRSNVRNISVNPVEGNLDWTLPQEIWSS